MVLNESTIPDLLSRPVNIKWEEGAPAPVASACHTAVLYNGAIYVGGGVCDDDDDDDYDDDDDDDDDDGNDMCKINIYHPDTNKWDDPIDTPHQLFAMTVLVDKLIIVGGGVIELRKVTNKLLALHGGQWEEYSQMPTARAAASVVSHQSMMIVMGGKDSDDHILSTVELLDITTGQWFKCNDCPRPLFSMQSVIIGDMLYTMGGGNTNGDDDESKAVYAVPLHALSNHQLEWQQLADTPWGASAAVSVNNKYLLAVGGATEHDAVCVLNAKKADLVITSTSWESIGTLPKVHRATSAVSLGNQIIVIGGTDEEYGNLKSVTIGTFQ